MNVPVNDSGRLVQTLRRTSRHSDGSGRLQFATTRVALQAVFRTRLSLPADVQRE